jgi:hypothetical protein
MIYPLLTKYQWERYCLLRYGVLNKSSIKLKSISRISKPFEIVINKERKFRRTILNR